MQTSRGPARPSVRMGAVLVTGAMLLAGCAGPTPPGDAARIDAQLVADLAPNDARTVSQAVNAFAFDLFDEVADGRQNTVTAPLSMTVLLAMILAGADGDTATELARVLHLGDRRDVRVGALLGKLADTDEVTLSVANSLWADPGRPFEADYLTFLRRVFGATVEQGDLGSPGTAEKIDAWASRNTNGLIDRIARDLGLPDSAAILVLLNAVYFLGEWTTRFDPGDTRPEPFTLADAGTADVPMMHLTGGRFGYAQRDGYRMLRLPYGEHGRYGMEIMLPDDGGTLADLVASLDAAQWRAAVDSLTTQTIDELALPRFELRWKGELTDPLRRLGISTAFTPGDANFRPMSPAAPCWRRWCTRPTSGWTSAAPRPPPSPAG
ncbi:serpin family protein [Plantactinospora soyae]|uniref:Serpin B n=1 Tax=Plantactinospora soyae TaxID=1544732 RepID=A0A927QYP4_9ACTN|nr:serpin family protein [Plantactinospora soyae]MBE1489450.1 serpin B [Plantactinospora soyae]